MIALVMTAFFVLLIIGMPIAHVVLASSTIGVLMGGKTGTILAQQLVLGSNSFLLLAVPFFIISGNIAAKGKTSTKIVNVTNAMIGRMPGSLGVATIFACVLFGAITGSSIACIVAIGTLMIPRLLENGYPRSFVLGLITVAGTLGVLIPPSIPMLQQAVAMSISAGAMFTAGFIPGLITALSLSCYVVIFAIVNKIPRVEEKLSFNEKWKIIKDGFWALMFPIIILGGIYSGAATPTEAAVISLFYILIVEFLIYKTFSFKEIYGLVRSSAITAATLTITVATAQVFVWYMTTEKLPDMIFNALTTYVSGPGMLWLLLSAMFLFVGLFTNETIVVVILGPLLVNVLGFYDISLIHFGIVAIMIAMIGFVTPPFGLCLFTTMKIAPANMPEVVKGSWVFMLILALDVLLFILVPSISTWLPNLIFG